MSTYAREGPDLMQCLGGAAARREGGAAVSLPKVGLYLRLSREDEGEGDQSMSIANQKTFLLQYGPAAGLAGGRNLYGRRIHRHELC